MLEDLRAFILWKAPFFAPVFIKYKLREADLSSIGTCACVDVKSQTIYLDFKSMKKMKMYPPFALLHEVMHCVLEHDPRLVEHKALFNIAADSVINSYIRDRFGWEYEDAWYKETIEEKFGIEMETHDSAYNIYDKLLKAAESIESRRVTKDVYDGNGNKIGSIEIEETVWKGKNGKEVVVEHHIVDIDRDLQAQIENMAKQCGSDPGNLVEVIKWKPRNPLHLKVRHLMETLLKPKIGRKFFNRKHIVTRNIIARRNAIIPESSPKIIAVIDTSGSMSIPELELALGTLFTTARKYGIKKIRIIQHDQEIQKDEEYDRVPTEFEIHGRGGTSHKPVIKKLMDENVKNSVIIFFSDFISDLEESDIESLKRLGNEVVLVNTQDEANR